VKRAAIDMLQTTTRTARDTELPADPPPASRAAAAVGGTAPAARGSAPATPIDREITLPAGTVLSIALESHLASDTSRPEDAVTARLRRAVAADGLTVLPSGSRVTGHVLGVQRSGRVKGRASLAVRFDAITPAGTDDRLEMRTAAITREARSTKKEDAVKIGGGAGAGALIGAIAGGKDGAAKGAAIGGGAGTAVVLGTRGEEVRLGPGDTMSVKLTQPLTVRVKAGAQTDRAGNPL
jgi:hypothetical protein